MNMSRALVLTLLIIGIVCIGVSAFYVSSYLAIIGVTFVFWGGVLLHIAPHKNVPFSFLLASNNANMSNIERILSELNFSQKGIYLPPKNLQDIEYSLVFIPNRKNQSLPQAEDTRALQLQNGKHDCLFVTPPGFFLSRLFEQKLSKPFTNTDFRDLQETLSRQLVENLALAENIKFQIQGKSIIVEIKGSNFSEDCGETQKYPLAHNAVGCLLSSSFACVLAKVTGKPVVIHAEERLQNQKTTKILYDLLEE